MSTSGFCVCYDEMLCKFYINGVQNIYSQLSKQNFYVILAVWSVISLLISILSAAKTLKTL